MLRNVIYLFSMQGINYLLPLLTLPYLVRILEPEGYGTFSFILVIAQYCVIISDFGFNLTSSAKIAKENNINHINQIYSETICSKIMIGIIICSITLIVVAFTSQLHSLYGLIIISFVQVFGSILTPIWLFQGMEIMKWFAILTVSSKLLCLPLTFFLVKTPDDVSIAIAINSSVYFISGLISILLAKRLNVKFIRVKLKNIITSLKDSSIIFIGTFSISLYTISTPLILGVVSNTYEVGIFSSADKIRGALLGVFIILGNVFYPRVNKLLSQDKEKALEFIYKILKYQSVITFISAVSFYYLSPYIVNTYLGSQYASADILLKIMSPMIFLIPASVVLSNYILLPLGYKKFFSSIPVVTSLIHLIYVTELSKRFGAEGASIAILITEIISFLSLLFINIKIGNLSLIVKRRRKNQCPLSQ